jgi:hypothetical protein
LSIASTTASKQLLIYTPHYLVVFFYFFYTANSSNPIPLILLLPLISTDDDALIFFPLFFLMRSCCVILGLLNSGHVPVSTLQQNQQELEFAVTGKGLACVRKYYSESILQALILRASVFARTKPADKKLIVEILMSTPEVTAVALPAAHPRRLPLPLTFLQTSSHSHSHSGGSGAGGNKNEDAVIGRFRQYGAVEDYEDRSGAVQYFDEEEAARPLLATRISRRQDGNKASGLSLNSIQGHGDEVTTNEHNTSIAANTMAANNSTERSDDEKCFHVLFCGDGANDMAALRAATVRTFNECYTTLTAYFS